MSSSVGTANRYRLDSSSPCRSQWPCGLKRGSAADRLLGLRIRNPLGAWMFVLCVVSKDKMTKCERVKTKKQVRMKYKQSTRE